MSSTSQGEAKQAGAGGSMHAAWDFLFFLVTETVPFLHMGKVPYGGKTGSRGGGRELFVGVMQLGSWGAGAGASGREVEPGGGEQAGVGPGGPVSLGSCFLSIINRASEALLFAAVLCGADEEMGPTLTCRRGASDWDFERGLVDSEDTLGVHRAAWISGCVYVLLPWPPRPGQPFTCRAHTSQTGR